MTWKSCLYCKRAICAAACLNQDSLKKDFFLKKSSGWINVSKEANKNELPPFGLDAAQNCPLEQRDSMEYTCRTDFNQTWHFAHLFDVKLIFCLGLLKTIIFVQEGEEENSAKKKDPKKSKNLGRRSTRTRKHISYRLVWPDGISYLQDFSQ